MKLQEIADYLESLYPLSLQESWDNSGLLVGHPDHEVKKILITLDITEAVVQEAIDKHCNVIISHHPVIFSGIKSLTAKTETERLVESAIKNDIALYALHTNLDNSDSGINAHLCEKLGLIHKKIIVPKTNILRKLVTFCPTDHSEKIRQALFEAGAGHIGNYESCSFNSSGTGTFKGSEDTNPFVGEKGKLHYEEEHRIETVYPTYLESRILKALFAVHPYEEVAFDIYDLGNSYFRVGSGMIGELVEETREMDFLKQLREIFGTGVIRHSGLTGNPVNKIAICSGSGSFLIDEAKKQGAGFFITSDVKYHEFFKAEGKIVIADIGHYESERFAKDLIHNVLIKKFPNFAVLISESKTNSVNYL